MRIDLRPVSTRRVRRRFKVIAAILAVSLVVVILFWIVDLLMVKQRVEAAQVRLFALMEQFAKENPNMESLGNTGSFGSDLHGCRASWEFRYKLSSGRPVAIEATLQGAAFDGPGVVVLTSKGKSATWSLEGFERDRAIDLRRAFAETFR
jgi:hypothetical protein